MARAVASPTAAASVRIFFIRSSGAKGLPFWIPVNEEAPPRDPEIERARPHDVVTGRLVTRVAGRQEQIFAALTLVRAGDAHIYNPPIPHVVDRTEHLRRHLHHQRPFAQV